VLRLSFYFIFFVVMFGGNAFAVTLDWATRPSTNLLTGTDVATVGGVTVTTTGSITGSTSSQLLQILPATTFNTHTGIIAAQFDATIDDKSVYATFTFTFSQPVSNLSFTLIDIDGGPAGTWHDTVVFTPIPAATAVGSNVSYTVGTGTATALGASVSDTTGDLTVNFAGPLISVSIKYLADDATGTNPGQQVLAIDDLTFGIVPTTVKLQKITTGGVGGPFTFSQSNLASIPAGITTVTAGTAAPVSPTVIAVATIGSAVSLTETLVSGFIFTTASCTDANGALTGNTGSIGTLSGSALTIPAGNVKPGSDYTCVFTNAKGVANMTVVKSASPAGPFSVGQVVTYTFKVKNTGNVSITSVSLNDTFNGFGSPPLPNNETLSLDAAPTGDSTNGTFNDGIWAALGPGDEVTFTAPYTVIQSDVDFRQ
jgi:hypothetical protein